MVEDRLGRAILTSLCLGVEFGVSLAEKAGLSCGVSRTTAATSLVENVDVGSETATLPVRKDIECKY